MKQYQYNTDVVGAFVTYEKNNDIKRIQTQFDRRNKDNTRPRLDFQVERPADPSNINWKNMQIKLSERFVRGFLVFLTLFALVYLSFLIQVLFSNWRFENGNYEKIDCTEFKTANNKNLFENRAFAAWSEYNIQGQWKEEVQESDDANLEQIDQDLESNPTSTFINGTLSCFCNAEYDKNGWFSTIS